MGHIEEALKYFEQCLLLGKELYEANPRSESLKNGLAISYSKLGGIHQSMGHMEEALKYFEQRSVLGKELYASNPQSVVLLAGLAISYYKLAMLYKDMGEDTQGKANFSEWKNRISYLVENFPQIPKYKEWNELEY
jgi:tetratricopeptide (TPR) repeat protein